MNDFIGAVDETKDGEYLAFMICDHASLIRNLSALPPTFTHMTSEFYSTDKQLKIIKDLDLNGNIIVCCIQYGIPSLRNAIKRHIDNRRVPQAKYRSCISYRMRKHLNVLLDTFLNKHRIKLDQINFQVDNEVTKRFLMEGGLKCVSASYAHKITDCIAYANYKGWSLEGDNVIEVGGNFMQQFRERILKDIGLK